MYNQMFSYHFLTNIFFWIAFIVLITYLICILNIKKSSKTLKELLDERLAKGEITKEEYDEIIKILKDSEGKKDESQ